MVIARYNSVIVVFERVTKYSGMVKFNDLTMKFICFFEGTDREFIDKFKPKYPNYKFQIFNHGKKPLSKELRKRIEESKDFSLKLREYNLSKLLD